MHFALRESMMAALGFYILFSWSSSLTIASPASPSAPFSSPDAASFFSQEEPRSSCTLHDRESMAALSFHLFVFTSACLALRTCCQVPTAKLSTVWTNQLSQSRIYSALTFHQVAVLARYTCYSRTTTLGLCSSAQVSTVFLHAPQPPLGSTPIPHGPSLSTRRMPRIPTRYSLSGPQTMTARSRRMRP
jgi:hypothetical protein